MQPLALIVMSDEIRHDIQETLQAFRDEGLTLKVISGDNLETVRAIAQQSGMDIGARAYTGAELDAMSEGEFDQAVRDSNVFARIEPDTKQRIVEALRRQGDYVAMVGDGVNDVPALKAANLAIVMNDGTQISKDVADIVLLNNAMSTLPRAFREGKETTQTIFGTMKMFLVRNFYGIAFFVFIAFMALPFPITPVQISWATFGTVNLPATLIAFRLAAATIHVAVPPRCGRLHLHDGLHRRGLYHATLSDHLVRQRRRPHDDALVRDDHGGAVWHVNHLACAGHRYLSASDLRASIGEFC